ncbi:hypothetical protein EKO27_g4803 [Xylaria grammica]|uniref:Uncharacterized protein n=1 Tax=Xylaria grammica TaxID=363999 RepID=A0A439D7D2_9PEZI|nr:hypothetical protein EKO27_g4803 [Xylaria grammica]
MSTNGPEMISRFLTSLWLYDIVTDRIPCANARQNLNDFLHYDCVAAPWKWWPLTEEIEVLRDQARADWAEPEDVWLTERLDHKPGARMANGPIFMDVSIYIYVVAFPIYNTQGPGEGGREYCIEGIDDWRDGFYEPMGHHTGGSDTMLSGGIWGNPALRRHIWNYCPEVKMTLAMDAAKYVLGDCYANWKRGERKNRRSWVWKWDDYWSHVSYVAVESGAVVGAQVFCFDIVAVAGIERKDNN